jgi:hypothetical protein
MHVNYFRLVIAITLALPAASQQTATDPAAVLQQTGERLLQDLQRMPRYTCVQTVTRTHYESQQKSRPTCSRLIAAHETRKHKLPTLGWDRLRLEVALVDGSSVYSWVGAPRFTDDTVDKLAGNGPLGSGDFGIFLKEILLRTTLVFQGEQVLDGRRLFEYSYDMPINKSTYKVNTSDGWAVTAFSGTLLLDPETSDLVRLTVRTGELPSNSSACQAISEVTYERTAIHERPVLVPHETQLSIISLNGEESLSHTSYANCREYASTVKLIFDGAKSDGAKSTPVPVTTMPVAAPPTKLPAGLHFDARIITPIDSDTAAAGDPIEAVLRSPIRNHKKEIIAPAGSHLHGRLRNVKWWSEPSDNFQITVQFESLEIGGTRVPLNAEVYTPLSTTLMGANANRMTLLKPDAPSIGGTFFFREDHLHLKHLDADWITIAPDADPGKK